MFKSVCDRELPAWVQKLSLQSWGYNSRGSEELYERINYCGHLFHLRTLAKRKPGIKSEQVNTSATMCETHTRQSLPLSSFPLLTQGL